MAIQKFIDLTNLKATATLRDITELCNTARDNGFFSVCVNPSRVKEAQELLKGSPVKICTVIGFPLGATSTNSKVAEAEQAVLDGADEIDMVMNIGKFLEGDYRYVLDDINAVCSVNSLVKVIIETCYLTDANIAVASQIVKASKADYIKTSTGFGTKGATAEHVKIMRANVGNKKGVKAAGGIRDITTAINMFNAGADRIGCSAMFEEIKSQDSNVNQMLLETSTKALQRVRALDCVGKVSAPSKHDKATYLGHIPKSQKK